MITVNLFITILHSVFWLAGLLTLILIVISFLQRYHAAEQDKGVIVAKAVLAIAAWLILSVGILFLNSLFVFAAHHSVDDLYLEQPLTLENAVVYLIGINLIWVLMGAGLIYWTGRRAKANFVSLK